MTTKTTKIVRSADGTTLAVDRFGDGPAVILVGGAFNDRSTVAGLAAVLAARFTVHTYDRRGRGASGDTPPYAVDRQMEDLHALITEAGGKARVFGHSSGAAPRARGLPIDGLAVYEPSYIVDDGRPRPAADLGRRMADLVADGRRGEAVRLFLVWCAGVPAKIVDAMRSDPSWAAMEKLAHTLPYDLALHGPRQSMPAERLAGISVPTLVIDGGESPDYLRNAARAVAAAVPGAKQVTLDGHDHGVLHHPDVLVPLLTRPDRYERRRGEGRANAPGDPRHPHAVLASARPACPSRADEDAECRQGSPVDERSARLPDPARRAACAGGAARPTPVGRPAAVPRRSGHRPARGAPAWRPTSARRARWCVHRR